MSIKTYDCANSAPAYNYTPWGFACFWNKPLPDSFIADIGPATNNTCDPACRCYSFPLTSVVRTSFTRTSACDWQSGVLVWQCSEFDYPLTLFVNTYEKIFQDDPDINPISNVFSFSGDPNPTGSCSWNPTTGETTGTISGVAAIESQGCSCGPCLIPYTLYFGTPP